MSDIEHDEWMSDSDALLWHIERDRLLRSTITAVWFLDANPDRTRLDAIIESLPDHLPRLKQRVVADTAGVATPRWEHDDLFDLHYHYRHVRLPGHASERTVFENAQRLASRSFDRDRPLWELRVFSGLPRKRTAMVLKVHHAIADGLGLVQMMQHLVTLSPDDDSLFDPGDAESVIVPSEAEFDDTAIEDDETLDHTARDNDARDVERDRAARHDLVHDLQRTVARRVATETKAAARLGRIAARTAGDLVRDPLGTIDRARKTTESIARTVQPAGEPCSPLMTGRSLRWRFDTLEVPLAELRAAAKTVDGKLNDSFVAAVLDGLHRYHEHHGVAAERIRMNMPVSVRPRDGGAAHLMTNQFVPARVVLPLGPSEPIDRLTSTGTALQTVTAEPALPHINDVSGLIGRLGPTIAVSVIGSMMKGVDITTSNVPGPPFPVYVAGSRIERFFAFGPLAGSAINITLFSYDGRLEMAINSDVAAVPDPDVLVSSLRAGFASIAALGTPRDQPN